MGKFTRVSESDTNSVLQKFASNGETQIDDPYAHLIAGANERQAQIARDVVDVKRERKLLADKTHEWETVRTAEVYQHPQFNPGDANVRPADIMGQAIRRVMSGQEEDPNPRMNPSDFGLMDREGYEALLESRVATMHNPEVYEMEDMLKASMQDRGYFDEESTEEKRAKRAAEWQRAEHQNVIRERQKVTARANPILLHRAGQSVLRTGEESVADGRFGLPDIASVIQHEKERAEQRLAAKDARDSIKSDHIVDAQTKHRNWEESVNSRASSVQDHKSSWLDNYVNGLGED